MNESLLKEQLAAADRQAGPPPVRGRVAERIWLRAEGRRRRRRYIPVAAAAMIIAAVGAGWSLWQSHGVISPRAGGSELVADPPVERADYRAHAHEAALADLQELRAQIARSERLVSRLQAVRRGDFDPVAPDAPNLDPSQIVQREAERAASTLIYTARNYEQSGRTPPAVQAYRRTIELFPATSAADLARRTLAAMQQQTGGAS